VGEEKDHPTAVGLIGEDFNITFLQNLKA